MNTTPWRTVRALATAAACLAVAGCTISGHAAPARLDLGVLDVGGYSKVPLDEPSVREEKYGRIVESVRMGEAIIDPVQADAALRFAVGLGIAALPTPVHATRRLAEAVRPVLEQQGMIAGFWVSGSAQDDEDGHNRQTIGSRTLSVTLLRFPDDASAKRAAAGIDAADFAVHPDNVAVKVRGFAEAHAHWRPTEPTLAATIAHGPFVVNVLVGHKTPDLAALSGLAADAFTAQVSALDKFQPTPVDQVAALSLDRDGMLRRSLPLTTGTWPFPNVTVTPGSGVANWSDLVIETGVVYGPWVTWLKYGRGSSNPDKPRAEAFAQNGFNGLIRYTDPATARRAYGDGKVSATSKDVPIDSPTGLPDVRCFDTQQTSLSVAEVKFYCHLLYDRYVVGIFAASAQDVRRKASAQFALLVNAG